MLENSKLQDMNLFIFLSLKVTDQPMMKIYIKRILTPKQFVFLKRTFLWFITIPFTFNLKKLAQIYKCDKWGDHYYMQHYQTHFQKFKWKRIKLLEIGVGGYDNPHIGGNSLRVWKRYFPFGRIYSFDIFNKSFLMERRIKIYQGSQVDEDFLTQTLEKIGEADIIIDDGSHINNHVITTFKFLFPKLKIGGIYVIEDTQTSYWPDYGGGNEEQSQTIMNYFKKLADGINYPEYMIKDYRPTYFDQHITSIHFYHNLIFIYKGFNSEGSNASFENRQPESCIK